MLDRTIASYHCTQQSMYASTTNLQTLLSSCRCIPSVYLHLIFHLQHCCEQPTIDEIENTHCKTTYNVQTRSHPKDLHIMDVNNIIVFIDNYEFHKITSKRLHVVEGDSSAHTFSNSI